MRHGIRLLLISAGLSVWSAGCIATEEWTQDLLGKQHAEMDNLLGKRQEEVDNRFLKVESGVREHGERLDKVESRVIDLEKRGVPKGGLAEKTSAVAVRRTAHRTLVNVVNVPFAFDRADLNASAEVALATIVTELRDNPHMTLDLEGTTDPVGRLDYNVKLSRRRVEAVKRRLVEQGIEPARIINSAARGPLLDNSVENNFKRRVMVKLMKLTD